MAFQIRNLPDKFNGAQLAPCPALLRSACCEVLVADCDAHEMSFVLSNSLSCVRCLCAETRHVFIVVYSLTFIIVIGTQLSCLLLHEWLFANGGVLLCSVAAFVCLCSDCAVATARQPNRRRSHATLVSFACFGRCLFFSSPFLDLAAVVCDACSLGIWFGHLAAILILFFPKFVNIISVNPDHCLGLALTWCDCRTARVCSRSTPWAPPTTSRYVRAGVLAAKQSAAPCGAESVCTL